jgi:hypothetical protein
MRRNVREGLDEVADFIPCSKLGTSKPAFAAAAASHALSHFVKASFGGMVMSDAASHD